MTKCRHYNTTFIIAVQTVKYVIKDIRRQATDLVIWAGLGEEDFLQVFKEIQFSYDVEKIWQEYRQLPNQKCHLILNCKAHSYRFVIVNIKFNDCDITQQLSKKSIGIIYKWVLTKGITFDKILM